MKNKRKTLLAALPSRQLCRREKWHYYNRHSVYYDSTQFCTQLVSWKLKWQVLEGEHRNYKRKPVFLTDRHRWEDNIKMDCKNIDECVEWSHLTQDTRHSFERNESCSSEMFKPQVRSWSTTTICYSKLKQPTASFNSSVQAPTWPAASRISKPTDSVRFIFCGDFADSLFHKLLFVLDCIYHLRRGLSSGPSLQAFNSQFCPYFSSARPNNICRTAELCAPRRGSCLRLPQTSTKDGSCNRLINGFNGAPLSKSHLFNSPCPDQS